VDRTSADKSSTVSITCHIDAANLDIVSFNNEVEFFIIIYSKNSMNSIGIQVLDYVGA
jgi:hypothetical protein